MVGKFQGSTCSDLKVLVAAFFLVPVFFVEQGLEVNMFMASNNQGQLYQLNFSLGNFQHIYIYVLLFSILFSLSSIL